ncbi:MAG: PorT family protein [Bacteroidales bacterium]|nr:PorT family protein [Bacteroidales bacterium]
MKTLYFVMRKITVKFSAALLTVLLFVTTIGLHAQDYSNYHLGFRGGVGMATLNGYQNNGLRLGLAAGVCGIYDIAKNKSIIAEFSYSMGGQQTEKWITETRDEMKEYSRFGFHYLNIPVLYQYYFPDILGLEGGLNFRYCMAGTLKTKIGNDSWHSANFISSDYNTFDFGLIIGVYTQNLIPHENFFVSLRAYFGFIDVVKNVGSNKNMSIQVSVGYMLF